MPWADSTTMEPSGHEEDIDVNMPGSYRSLNVWHASSYTFARSASENPLRYTIISIAPLVHNLFPVK